MNTNGALALNDGLREKLSTKIKEALFDLLPEEKINELITAEIRAFFEDESFKMEVREEEPANLGLDRNARKAIVLTAKVSAFRHLVRQSIIPEVEKRIKKALNDSEGEYQKALEDWFVIEVGNRIDGDMAARINVLATTTSKAHTHMLLQQAMTTSYQQVMHALESASLDYVTLSRIKDRLTQLKDGSAPFIPF